jgi:phytoene synthase
MEPELAASYRAAEAVARKRARNFYYSFVVLPPEKRRAFCAVYAFMRQCDDISDGGGSAEQKCEGLRCWRNDLNAALAGRYNGNPIFPAFRDSVRRYSIPPQYFHWIIDGAEMDLTTDHYETFEELYRYCFRVASAVGLVCLQIFGFSDAQARQYAEECGIAFQLTNILRDIKEDAAMGRIYLPGQDLRQFQYDPGLLGKGVRNESFGRLMAFEANRAMEYYSRARRLLPLVDESSRPALWAMMEIYGRILAKIVRRQYDVFGERINLSGLEKAMILLRATGMRFLPRLAPR